MPDSKADATQFRLIAIDLDGTLLNSSGDVTPRTAAAVRAAAAAGWCICYATGRTLRESKAILDAIGHYDVGVFVGGAMVVDTASGVVLQRAIMSPQLASDVCRFFEQRDQIALALQDRVASDVDYLITERSPLPPATQLWMQIGAFETRPIPSLADYIHADTLRVSVAGHPAEMAALLADLNAAFGARIQSHSVQYHHFEIDVLEVFDPTVDKWDGICRAAVARNIRPEQTIAIGDNMNDLPMIRGAGLGVAMGNAKAAVQSAAARVIASNESDGVAQFLEEMIVAGNGGAKNVEH